MPNPEHKKRLRIANTIAVFMAMTGGLIGLNRLVDHKEEEKPKIEIAPTWTPEEAGINNQATWTPKRK